MWQEELKNNITTVEDLERVYPLTAEEKSALEAITEIFPMSISRYYFSLIDQDDPDDPIRKLCIPGLHEFDQSGLLDTSGEAYNTKMDGLQHKYAPTALMLSTNLCPTYCRFCFRRRMVGLSDAKTAKRIDHVAGKIEMLGMQDDKHMIFKYHQAKDPKDNARIFTVDVSDVKAWL